jgi:hypothetical protein
MFAAAIGLMSLLWIAPVPADPPRTDSSILLVIEQAAPVCHPCPFV